MVARILKARQTWPPASGKRKTHREMAEIDTMAENNAPGGGGAPQAGDDAQQPQVNVVGQYIKDLSFEAPDTARLFRGPGKNPNLQLNFNVQVSDLKEAAYEVALTLEGEARSEEGLLYKIELVYAGAFVLRNLPQEAIHPVLFIECPALLFPFARRLAADLTREGGFPPLLLDPIDFGGLYRRRIEMGQQPSIMN
jgi:preprotein translocase subunit SecB